MNIPPDFNCDPYKDLLTHMERNSGSRGLTCVGKGRHREIQKTKECHFLSAVKILSYNSQKSIGEVITLEALSGASSRNDLPYEEYLWDIFFNSGGWFNRGNQKNPEDSLPSDLTTVSSGSLKNQIKAWKDGYVCNYDNFTKTVLLLNRASIRNTPLILMGETGCGKTYQINFMLEILLRVPEENIVRETLNAGTQISKLVDVLNTTVKRARSDLGRGQDYWIFFDEFNTSDFQTILSELMNDRTSM
jgi:hypothetical protein